LAEIKPLPIYPSTPTGADLAMFKEAKESLSLPFLIKPVRAVPGSPGRIIALRERPNFICDHAFIPEPNPKSILEALKWATGENHDPRAVSVAQMLSEIFKSEVTEIAIPENTR